MSFYVEATFRIRKKQLTRDLIRNVIRTIHSINNYSVSNKEQEELVKLLYNNGNGNDEGFEQELFKSGAHHSCLLGVLTNKGAYTIPIPQNVVYIILLGMLGQFDSDWGHRPEDEVRKNREMFVRDAMTVYSIVHSDWGAIGIDTAFYESVKNNPQTTYSDHIYPVNFYGPELAKKIDIEELRKLDFGLEKLQDGGLMVRFGQVLHVILAPNEREMARKLVSMTGQKVWWKE